MSLRATLVLAALAGEAAACMDYQSEADWIASNDIKCQWDHAQNKAVPTPCIGLDAAACAANPQCVEWIWPGTDLTCAPSVPKMICRTLNNVDCTDSSVQDYCAWNGNTCDAASPDSTRCAAQDGNSAQCQALGCSFDARDNTCQTKFRCELIADAAQCAAASCNWETHPAGHFKWCTEPMLTCANTVHWFMCERTAVWS